jgi:hypothetical protein
MSYMYVVDFLWLLLILMLKRIARRYRSRSKNSETTWHHPV